MIMTKKAFAKAMNEWDTLNVSRVVSLSKRLSDVEWELSELMTALGYYMQHPQTYPHIAKRITKKAKK